MKRNHFMVSVLFGESLLFPAFSLICAVMRYSLTVNNGLLYAAVTTAVYTGVGVLLLTGKDRRIGRVHAVLLAVTLLLNQINALFFLFTAKNVFAVILTASWIAVAAAVAAVYVKRVGLKVAFYVISGVLVHPICLLILLSGFPTDTVVAREISPGGAYCAEVIDNDQGALGGATILNVYKYSESFSIGSFDFRKEETEVYNGGWGEFETLRWIDDGHLQMNGTTYKMADYFD